MWMIDYSVTVASSFVPVRSLTKLGSRDCEVTYVVIMLLVKADESRQCSRIRILHFFRFKNAFLMFFTWTCQKVVSGSL